MKKTRLFMAAVCAAAAAAVICACGSGASSSGSSASNTQVASSSSGSSSASEASSSDGRVEILLWHSMSGTNQEVIETLVKNYNESQDSYNVTAVNQGTYDESTSKFFSMLNGEGAPQIIQIGEQNLQSMIDSGLIQSVSALIEKHNFDDSDLLAQAVNFYTVNDIMYVMPFNCSTAVVYYNKQVFADAGYDEFPLTFNGITEAAEAVKASGSSVTPVGMYAYGYALDQMITNMGGYIINNENGRAARATEVAYQPEITEMYNWVKDLNDKGLLVNYGSDRTNTVSGFSQQQCGMFFASSAIARSVMDSCDFEVGIAYLPIGEGDERQGVYAGGGAMCVADGLSEEEEAGVMDFFRYATSAEVQAAWAGDTGYYPICYGAYETELMQASYEQYPQLEVSSQQLLDSKVNSITAGPLLSQLPQLRTDLQTALEEVFNGGDVDKAITNAVNSTNAAIEQANLGVG